MIFALKHSRSKTTINPVIHSLLLVFFLMLNNEGHVHRSHLLFFF